MPSLKRPLMERYIRTLQRERKNSSRHDTLYPFDVDPVVFGDNDESRQAVLTKDKPLDPNRTEPQDTTVRAVAAEMLPQLVDLWESEDSTEIAEAADSYVNSNYFSTIRYELTAAAKGEIDSIDSSIQEPIDLLDKLTSMDLPDNINMYRGMGFKGKLPFNLEPGTEFVDPSFTSTSTSLSKASSFTSYKGDGSFVMKITAPNGVKGAPVNFATIEAPAKSGMSGDPLLNEQELLLARNTKFRITKVEQLEDMRYPLVHAEIVEQDADVE